jgi:galactose-1-phosphate uridylyltransferase
MSGDESLPTPSRADKIGQRRITDLDALVHALSPKDRTRFERIFHVSTAVGQVAPPQTMHGWILDHFGSVDAVRRQRIVKVTNKITLEGALFNELRARRPIEAPHQANDLDKIVQEQVGGPFCHPREGTPADVFGRVRGRFSLTASNIAKYDAWHAVVIFDEHHPLSFSAEQVVDYVDTAQGWAQEAHRADPEARYPCFLWNCLWRSGASILHGHAQMTLSRGMPYAKIENWRQSAIRYRASCGAGYFDDLITIYRALGLAVDRGQAVIFPTLTPFKEKETQIIAPHLDEDLKEAMYHVLYTFVERLGVQCFNLILYQPPLAITPENWDGFPLIARIIDRGSLQTNTSDLGAMEMFAQSVVASDPFRVTDALEAGIEEEAS